VEELMLYQARLGAGKVIAQPLTEFLKQERMRGIAFAEPLPSMATENSKILPDSAIEAGPKGPRPGGIATRRSEERRRGRKGVRPKARARSAGGERADEASDH
jgi:hypothetical protein